ncbi:MAG: hypothetical protein KDG49_22205, partial [Geminicoccaceae bacterium]|nr:hypothetical protein [Geminicoccaceae bacterium]
MMIRLALLLITLGAGLFAYDRFIGRGEAERREHAAPVHRDATTIEVNASLAPDPADPAPLADDVARESEVALVFRGGSGEAFRAYIDRDQTNIFLQGTLAFLDERRKIAHSEVERGLEQVFSEAFADKEGAIEAFADWFYGWGESWKFLFQAAKGAASELLSFDKDVVMEQARVAMEKHLLTHYESIVLKPEIRDPKIVQ